MIDTAEVISSNATSATISSRSTFVAVSLMSFAALLLELGLTRLFSVVLFYHFAFLAISIALLGLGAGAVFAYLRRSGSRAGRWRNSAQRYAPPTPSSSSRVLEVVLHTAVSLNLNWPNFWRLTVLYLVSAVPFFMTGLLFSIVFARHRGAHHPALRRRSAGRLAGLSGAGAAAERHRRTQHDFVRRLLCACRSGMGRARQAPSSCGVSPCSRWCSSPPTFATASSTSFMPRA